MFGIRVQKIGDELKGKLTVSLVMILLFVSYAKSQPTWMVNLDLQAGESNKTLAFGGSPDASDGLDIGLDVIAPPPPPEDYYAVFEITDPDFSHLSQDIRHWVSPYEEDIDWTLVISNADDIETTMTWDPSDLPIEGFFTLIGTNTIDMRNNTSAGFTGNNTLTIQYRHGVLLNVKVWLEGAYQTGSSMSTDLKDNSYIPTDSPYSEDTRTAASVPNNVTDWVLVQLRSSATGAALVSKSSFLRRDGKIVADDGTTEYIELQANAGSYYVVVKHRNHLAVMSANTVALSSGSSTLYDFSTGSGKFYGTSGAKELEPGVWGMWSGDINQDGEVTTQDYTTWYNSARAGDSGYQTTDINLDGEVTTSDYTIWYNNARAGASSTVPAESALAHGVPQSNGKSKK